MRLSVVMSVRNGEPYVREAIESVLAQSVTDFEFLIVDDASTDRTAAILAEYQRRDSRIAVLRNEHRLGPYPSANRGLALARADRIARHDADDISPPDRFAVQLQAFGSDEEVALVTGAVEAFGEKDRHVRRVRCPPMWQPKLEWELLFRNVVAAGAHVMFPRLFRGVPVRFQEDCRYAEDYRLWCRLSRVGRVVCPPQVVYRQRLHGASISRLQSAEQECCASTIRQERQLSYLRAADPDALLDMARFWIADGSRPLAGSVESIRLMLIELRENFLADIERRYGPRDREILDAEIDRTLSERLGYWLVRSISWLDWRTCAELLAAVDVRRQPERPSRQSLSLITAAALQKFWRRGHRAAGSAIEDGLGGKDPRLIDQKTT